MADNMYQSQACQDQFVEAALNGKCSGYWLELGGNDAKRISNTYYLEKALGWSGVTVEFDEKHKDSYDYANRNRTHLFLADATLLDYPKIFDDMPDSPRRGGIIDYLQIDLEPKNGSTWSALQLIERDIMPLYRFATATFEHDCYNVPSERLREPSRELFKRNGYKLVFPDVVCYTNGPAYAFEDWYVHPDAVDAAGLAALLAEQPSMPKVVERLKPSTLSHGLLPQDCVALTKKHLCKQVC